MQQILTILALCAVVGCAETPAYYYHSDGPTEEERNAKFQEAFGKLTPQEQVQYLLTRDAIINSTRLAPGPGPLLQYQPAPLTRTYPQAVMPAHPFERSRLNCNSVAVGDTISTQCY